MPDAVILSIKLQSGTFETSVSVPIKDDSTVADFNDAISRWLALAGTALQHGIEEMKATISPAETTRKTDERGG